MFNGIIYNQGFIKSFKKNVNSSTIEIESPMKFKKNEVGSSISCNGVCLTLTKCLNRSLFFYLSNETLSRSNFKNIKIGEFVNLEKSMSYGQNISGHYSQGHVDTTGVVLAILIFDKAWNLKIKIKNNFKKFLIEKGSIIINGVSLTISKVFKSSFEISIIPHTLQLTNLIKLKKKNIVNIEFDIFSKYLINLKK
ncbi:MAG: riboflavin synthase [Pelagibacterales bacterium]|nr:riboflavin synthase [Pelagibacterales bacterium]